MRGVGASVFAAPASTPVRVAPGVNAVSGDLRYDERAPRVRRLQHAQPMRTAQPPARRKSTPRLRELPREGARNRSFLTAHGAKNDAQGSMCQACHGDASEHLKDPTQGQAAGTADEQDGDRGREDRGLPDLPRRATATWRSGSRASTRRTMSPARTATTSTTGRDRCTVAPYTTSFRPNEADVCGKCHQQVALGDAEAVAPPDHREQDEVLGLPQPARRADAGDAAGARRSTSSAIRATPTSAVRSCSRTLRSRRTACPATTRTGRSTRSLLNEKAPNLCQDCHDVAAPSGTIYGGAAGFQCPPAATTDPQNTACFGKAPGSFNTAVNTRLHRAGAA